MDTKKDTNLNTFLKNHQIFDREKEHTHTWFSKPGGKFYISDDDNNEFIKLYSREAEEKNDLHVVARPRNIGQLKIDIDFRFDSNKKERQYTIEHIKIIIQRVFDIILDISNDHREILAFVLEKKGPNLDEKNNQYKDGFHIEFPEIIVDKLIRYYIIETIKNEIDDNYLFHTIPFLNDLNEVFDMSIVIRNGWMMYGSRKEFGKPYRLTHIFNKNLEEIELSKFKLYDIVSLLDNRKISNNPLNIKDDNEIKIKIEKISIKYEKKNNKQVCTFLDETAMSTLPPSSSVSTLTGNCNEQKNNKSFKRSKDKVSDVIVAKKLLEIISDNRAANYSDWINVGWTLHNINSIELEEDWIKFSKRCINKFNLQECKRVWNSARDGGYSISSLFWWAKNDNPTKYLEIIRDNINWLLVEAESGTHYDIARVIYELYKYFFKCSSIDTNTWYEFQENKWVLVEKAYTLSNIISSDLVKDFCYLSAYYMTASASREGTERDAYINKANNINQKIINNLKKHTFKDSVLKECANLFIDSTFFDKLNENKDLLGFDNGVYDLKLGLFRPGTPDDHITFSVGYKYIEFTEDHEIVKKIYDYFSKVQVDPEMRHYLFLLMSSFLDGHTHLQKFIFWTGCGCHLKNTPIQLFNKQIKNVQDVLISDILLGDDNKPRHILELHQGRNYMYTIYNDEYHINYTVNKDHRLALRFTDNLSNCIKITGNQIECIFYVYNNNILTILKKCYTHNSSPENGQIPFSGGANDPIEINANKFYLNYLEQNKFCIKPNDIIPITVTEYLKNINDLQYSFFGIKLINNTLINYNINIKYYGYDNYYGFSIDSNQRYLFNDNIITYNSNAKSTTVELLQNSLGDYFSPLAITVLTRKRGSASNATPELADKKGKRALVLQEPEDDDHINVGLMKQFTGGDLINARELYKKEFRFRPQWTLFIACNKLPYIPSNDHGTWRRIVTLPFESCFLDELPPQPTKYQFKKDRSLSNELPYWKQAFIWILLKKYYPIYITSGIKEPAKVLEHTLNYKKDNDMFLEFISENFIIDEKNIKDFIPGKELYEIFKNWYKESRSKGYSCPDKKQLIGYFISHNHKVIRERVFGIKLKDFTKPTEEIEV